MNFKVTQVRWVLERQIHWIASADSKLTIIGPLPLAMMTFSLIDLDTRLIVINWQDAPLLVSTACLFLSMLFSALSLSSRLNGPSESNIYFKTIGERELSNFVNDVLKETEEQHLTDLAQQVHINAQIATEKHKNITRAILMLVIAVPFWLATVAGV